MTQTPSKESGCCDVLYDCRVCEARGMTHKRAMDHFEATDHDCDPRDSVACEICGSTDPARCSFEVCCSCWRGVPCVVAS